MNIIRRNLLKFLPAFAVTPILGATAQAEIKDGQIDFKNAIFTEVNNEFVVNFLELLKIYVFNPMDNNEKIKSLLNVQFSLMKRLQDISAARSTPAGELERKNVQKLLNISHQATNMLAVVPHSCGRIKEIVMDNIYSNDGRWYKLGAE